MQKITSAIIQNEWTVRSATVHPTQVDVFSPLKSDVSTRKGELILVQPYLGINYVLQSALQSNFYVQITYCKK